MQFHGHRYVLECVSTSTVEWCTWWIIVTSHFISTRVYYFSVGSFVHDAYGFRSHQQHQRHVICQTVRAQSTVYVLLLLLLLSFHTIPHLWTYASIALLSLEYLLYFSIVKHSLRVFGNNVIEKKQPKYQRRQVERRQGTSGNNFGFRKSHNNTKVIRVVLYSVHSKFRMVLTQGHNRMEQLITCVQNMKCVVINSDTNRISHRVDGFNDWWWKMLALPITARPRCILSFRETDKMWQNFIPYAAPDMKPTGRTPDSIHSGMETLFATSNESAVSQSAFQRETWMWFYSIAFISCMNLMATGLASSSRQMAVIYTNVGTKTTQFKYTQYVRATVHCEAQSALLIQRLTRLR